jgi:hypothetical protein
MPLYIQVNKFPRQAILPVPSVCCCGARPAGHKTTKRDQPPAKPFSSKATTTTLTEAVFESKGRSTSVSKVEGFSYAQVFKLQNRYG